MSTSNNKHYIVAGSRPWSRELFEEHLKTLPGTWSFAESASELAALIDSPQKPRYIFFLHWSARVPDQWVDAYECVCFHMTDVPYGRGGSPLQNLIQRGHRETKITALRMVREMDAGPVYAKRSMSLEGNAEEIYLRAGRISADIIREMIITTPRPEEQRGQPTVFVRRRPEQSAIPLGLCDLSALHDFIRMLDAEGYPHAFIEHGCFRLEFSRAALKHGQLVVDVKVTMAAGHRNNDAPRHEYNTGSSCSSR